MLKLVYSLHNVTDQSVSSCNRYNSIFRYSINGADKEWLGSTYSNKLYISNLQVDGNSGTVQFTVQVQYKSGVIQRVNHASTYTFTY